MIITVNIDSELTNNAEQELLEILINQRISYWKRWYIDAPFEKPMFGLGILFLFIGFVLTILLIFTSFPAENMLTSTFVIVFLLAFGLFLIKIKSVNKLMYRNLSNKEPKTCAKLAKSIMKNVHENTPYSGEYELKHPILNYYRLKSDGKELRWSKPLKGVAIHGETITVIYKKWTSIAPKFVLFKNQSDAFNEILTALNIEGRNK